MTVMATRIPIAADEGLFLRVIPAARGACSRPDAGRAFAAAFRRVWERLPANVRAALLCHWRSKTAGLFGDGDSPRIELGARAMTQRWRGLPVRVACCTDDGHTLRFRPEWDAVPAADCARVIAHEIAHAYRWAAGAVGPDVDEEETAADRLADEWGFGNVR